MAIAIENLIRIDRIVIDNFQTDLDLFFLTRPWLKMVKQTLVEKPAIEYPFAVNHSFRLLYTWLPCYNRILIFYFQPDLDSKFFGRLWSKNFQHDPDRDLKPDSDQSDRD